MITYSVRSLVFILAFLLFSSSSCLLDAQRILPGLDIAESPEQAASAYAVSELLLKKPPLPRLRFEIKTACTVPGNVDIGIYSDSAGANAVLTQTYTFSGSPILSAYLDFTAGSYYPIYNCNGVGTMSLPVYSFTDGNSYTLHADDGAGIFQILSP